MALRKFDQFVNESYSTDRDPDISQILALMVTKNVPMDEIKEFSKEIELLSNTSERINESFLTNLYEKLKAKFQDWFDDKIWKYIINRKSKFYTSLMEDLKMFDLTTLDDVIKSRPGFKLDTMYLAGGMDKSADVGAGWRNVLEYEFDVVNKVEGANIDLEPVDLGEFGKIQPCRVVDDYHIVDFLEEPSKVKEMYAKPLLLNPVRKEIDRTKSKDFSDAITSYKSFTHETQPEEYEPTMTNLRKTMNASIEVDDEHLVRLADAIFLGLNEDAASGTYGELQMQSFLNKPVFVWMSKDSWKFSDFSIWSFPHFSKFARNEEEMKILVNTLVNFTK